MAHQAKKPFEISQVLNLFCSRQGPLCMKKASGFWSKFICSASRVVPCPTLCTAAQTWCTVRCSVTYGRQHHCSLQCPPRFLPLCCSKAVVGTAYCPRVTQYLQEHQMAPETWLLGAIRVWIFLGTRSLKISKGGPNHLLKAKWRQTGASWETSPHLFNSKDVKVLLYILL